MALTNENVIKNVKQLFFDLELQRKRKDESTGFLICEGIGARTGVQPYQSVELPSHVVSGLDGMQAVYRGPEFIHELAQKMSTGSIPVTNEHFFVEDGKNVDKIVGWVTGARSEQSASSPNDYYLIVNLTLFDPDVITKIEAKQEITGLSVGYYCSTDAIAESQVWVDSDGVVGVKDTEYPYSLVVNHPTINHLALCTLGRAGLSTQIYADSQKLYPYPDTHPTKKLIMDEQQQKQLQDMITQAMDGMSKNMCDSLGATIKDTLYGAFTSGDFQNLIREMYNRDKKAADPEEQATQQKIMNTAEQNGFYKDSADFGHAVMDSLKVWKELGSEAANITGINEASTGDEIRLAWIASKGIQLSDSTPSADILSIYQGLRTQSQTQPQPQQTAVKAFFDAAVQSAPTQTSGLEGVANHSDGSATYF